MKKISLSVPDDVAEWLKAQPDGGAACITDAVRRQQAGRDALQANIDSILTETGKRLVEAFWKPVAPPAPAKPQVNAEVEAALKTLESKDPALARRAAALSRYPQLVDVVARGLVTIDRAEEMAEEADARARR